MCLIMYMNGNLLNMTRGRCARIRCRTNAKHTKINVKQLQLCGLTLVSE